MTLELQYRALPEPTLIDPNSQGLWTVMGWCLELQVFWPCQEPLAFHLDPKSQLPRRGFQRLFSLFKALITTMIWLVRSTAIALISWRD